MAQIDPTPELNDTSAEHLSTHAELARLHNILDDSGEGSSSAAIHDNVASEISAITAKGTPVDGDFLLVEDSAAANVKKSITIGDLPAGDASPLTTKGDIAGYTTVDARVAVGSNDQVLTADSSQALGIKWATPAAEERAGLAVSELSADTTLTASGVYIVDTSGANITITLPILSGTPASGYRIQVLREGANYVYVVPNVADTFWDTTTQKTIFDDYGASSVVVGASSTVWLELGRYRTVT